MSFKVLSEMFQRALSGLLHPHKFLIIFLTLLISGLIFLFFQSLAMLDIPWLKLSLHLLPLFIMLLLLMNSGSLIMRINQKGERLSQSLSSCWEPMARSFYCIAPLLLSFIVVDLLLGLFLLLKSIPYLGTFLGIILAFVPFMLTLSILCLLLCGVVLLFFATPPLATTEKIKIKELAYPLRQNLFSQLICLVVGVFPLIFFGKLLFAAAAITFKLFSKDETPFEIVLQSLFILIPFAALLTFPMVFFFNFAFESYENMRRSQESSQ